MATLNGVDANPLTASPFVAAYWFSGAKKQSRVRAVQNHLRQICRQSENVAKIGPVLQVDVALSHDGDALPRSRCRADGNVVDLCEVRGPHRVKGPVHVREREGRFHLARLGVSPEGSRIVEK